MATVPPTNTFQYNEKEFALTVEATFDDPEFLDQLIIYLNQGQLKTLRTLGIRARGKLYKTEVQWSVV